MKWLRGAVLEVALAIPAVALLVAAVGLRAAPDPEVWFREAIRTAATRTGAEPRPVLFALNEDNAELSWRKEAAAPAAGEGREAGARGTEKQVLAAVVTSTESASQHYRAKGYVGKAPSQHPVVWITLVPQLRRFCTALGRGDPSERVVEYLGLRPGRDYSRVAQIWVSPSDVFRPCPDPAVSDASCDLTWKAEPDPPVKNVPDYAAFFAEMHDAKYRPDGAPWTRLGFTYDYAGGRYGVGASEYMLVPDAEFEVESVSSLRSYCTR